MAFMPILRPAALWICLLLAAATAPAAEDWTQLQGNAQHSGNAPGHRLDAQALGLAGVVEFGDALQSSPVAADGLVYAVDGSGLCRCVELATLREVWHYQLPGGALNCNQVSAPAIAGDYLHLAGNGGHHVVLNRRSGEVKTQRRLPDPIYSAPVVSAIRVYVVTLGARVLACSHDGSEAWQWDFVHEVVGFKGDRWSGEQWAAFCAQRLKNEGKKTQASTDARVTWRDHFVCSRDACMSDAHTLVIPAGGRTVFLRDDGNQPRLLAQGEIPEYAGREYPATFGQSADDQGRVFVQWHRRDNAGRSDIMQWDEGNAKLKTGSFVPGTETNIRMEALLSFAPVAIRGEEVFRVRPEQGAGLMLHALNNDGAPRLLSARASIAPVLLSRDHAVHCGLDGVIELIPLAGGQTRELATAQGSAISAAPALCDGRLLVPCEDGRLYLFAPGGKATLPSPRPDSWYAVRSRLQGPLAGKQHDWYTNYGNFAGQNANDQGLQPPLRMRWTRRLEGTVKHLPVCGGGRLYTHTAEGQILAMEQDTGRLIWRRHFPDVFLSFTSPLYHEGKLLIPQAGLKRSMLRCLDAATGQLLWEAPFTGSPSWSRQFPPVVHGNLAIYASGSGNYAAQGSEKPWTFGGEPIKPKDGREVMSFIYSNDNPYYPADNHPRLWAWDLNSGKLVWQKDFSEHGRGGNDCGLCLLDGRLYYSVFFGYDNAQRARRGLPSKHNGLTASLNPQTGEVQWLTHDYFVTAKCTLSARDGRLYLGGNNRAQAGTEERFVWCLNAADGKLLWRSQPVTSALNVVSVGQRYIFCNALRGKGNVFDRDSGNVNFSILTNYACCRFTMSEPYVLGANMDMIDLSRNGELVSTGPAIDSRECLGAVVSNGRVFYTSQASGFVVSQTYGPKSRELPPVWEASDEEL
jgi:outer membrane protein assembly factor BamB